MARQSFKRTRKVIDFDIEGEEFEALTVPGPMFLEFSRSLKDDHEAESAEVLCDIFRACITPEEDFERFWKVCNENFDTDGMVELLRFMAGRSADRPTEPSSRSARGRGQAKVAGGSSAAVRALGNSTSENSAT